MSQSMRALALVALTSLFLLGMGPIRCSPVSLEPIYTEKELVFEPALLGIWHESDYEAHVRITQSDDDMVYRMLIVGGEFGDPATFDAHLVKLKQHLFLDLRANPDDLELSGWYAGSIVWAHQFLLVKQLRPTPVGVFMEDKWLTEYFKKRPRAIRHIEPEKGDNFIIFTASTKKVQRFLRKAVKGGAFDEHNTDEIWKLTPSKATALHFVAAQGDTAQVTSLINQGAKTDAGDEAGRTPLHWAAAYSKTPRVIGVLLDAHTDVNITDAARRTPLMLAVARDRPSETMINLLISKGASVNVKNAKGETPLALATKQHIVELLKRHGAKK